MIDVSILIEILVGLFLSVIIGAFSFSLILYKCVHRQAKDIQIMKKATSFVLRRQVQVTKQLHPEEKEEIEDLEKTYKDLIDNSEK